MAVTQPQDLGGKELKAKFYLKRVFLYGFAFAQKRSHE